MMYLVPIIESAREIRSRIVDPRLALNRTCQSVGVVHPTHILQCARAHDCTDFHLLSVNENLCLSGGVEKVVGWSPLRWNRQSPDLYPSYQPHPFMYYHLI